MSFLPETYDVPQKEGQYMKFKSGDNRFRILASPIIGWEWWMEDSEGRKPVRVRMDGKVPTAYADSVKHFWAMPVWNYNAGKVQILEVTQKTIQKYIKSLARNSKWGSPLEYDLIVTKTGEKLETEYEIMADPKEPVSAEIQKTFESLSIQLEALFEGDDPFNSLADRVAEDVGAALN